MKLTSKEKLEISLKIVDCFPENVSIQDFKDILNVLLIGGVVTATAGEKK